ncbi:MAG TPA: DUF86 domain-containing protein [Thermoanaerobaculia bacterium]|nr:DUF86 domain-containing protein [Thermoanaerobaculia bacterium]
MIVAGRRIQEFIAGQDFADFSADLKTQSAVILQILILGEAAKRLFKEFQERHSEIPWKDMSRMRDRLIHPYEGTDPREVWQAASRDVPALLAILGPLTPWQIDP